MAPCGRGIECTGPQGGMPPHMMMCGPRDCPPGGMPPHHMPPHVARMMMRHGMMPPHMGGACRFRGNKDCCGDGFKGTKPVLTYFDVMGLAEQSRLCFLAGDVSFVDRRVTREDWAKHYKAYSPTGRGPYLEVNGQVLVESQAILLYAARRGGLMPHTPEDNLKAQMVIERMENDMKDLAAPAPEDMEGRMQYIIGKLKETHVAWADKLEQMLKGWMNVEGGDEWILANRMSYLDVYVAAAILRFQDLSGFKDIPDEEKYPVLTKVYQGVMNLPRVKEYLAAQQKKKAEKLVLHHFGYNAFMQPIMWVLKLGEIGYESKEVTRDEWAAGYKAQSPSGKLPMLEVDGEKYVESVAIMQYVATRAGLMPESPFDAAHALAAVKVCSELADLTRSIFHCQEPEAKAALIEKSSRITVPEMVARIEEVVRQRQDQEGHIVGKKLSYADLWVAQTFHFLLRCGELGIKLNDVEKMAPRMKKTYAMVFALAPVREMENAEMTKVKPVLTYFNIAGRAESLRVAMHLGGIDFEDRRISFEDWAATYKAMSPTGQCPFLTIGQGQTIVEAKAIMQWIVEIAPKLNPTSCMGKVIAEQLVSSWSRVDLAIKPIYSVPEAERPALKAQLKEEKMAPALAIQERLWSDSKMQEGYSVGDKTTWVDAWVAGELEYLKDMNMVEDNWQETYPTLAAIYRRVTTDPAIAAYRAALRQ